MAIVNWLFKRDLDDGWPQRAVQTTPDSRLVLLDKPESSLRQGEAPTVGWLYRYEGCVLETRERNYHDDSDFYAVVWDSKEKKIKTVDYASTHCSCYRVGATIDATEAVKKKADRWLVKYGFAQLKMQAEAAAKWPEKGKRVRVVYGRKVPHGTEGVVIWVGEKNYGPYGQRVTRIGIATDDEKEQVVRSRRDGTTYVVERHAHVVWTASSNVEVVDPEQYVPTDKELRARAKSFAGRYSAPARIAAAGAGLAVL